MEASIITVFKRDRH